MVVNENSLFFTTYKCKVVRRREEGDPSVILMVVNENSLFFTTYKCKVVRMECQKFTIHALTKLI
jgi:hypothetical protein